MCGCISCRSCGYYRKYCPAPITKEHNQNKCTYLGEIILGLGKARRAMVAGLPEWWSTQNNHKRSHIKGTFILGVFLGGHLHQIWASTAYFSAVLKFSLLGLCLHYMVLGSSIKLLGTRPKWPIPRHFSRLGLAILDRASGWFLSAKNYQQGRKDKFHHIA